MSATECAAALRGGDVSAVELVDEAIARIEALNPRLNIVVATAFEQARSKAIAADAALAGSDPVGPLHGLPITVKDSFEVADLVTTCGVPRLRDHRPDTDAVAVKRLTDAGAIVLGKTNVPLFASDWQSYNASLRPDPEPLGPRTNRGGSSGGAAAALPPGWVPLEIGATSPAPSAYRHTSAVCTATSRRMASSRCADTFQVPPGRWRLPT